MNKVKKEIVKQRFDESSFELQSEYRTTSQKVKVKCKSCGFLQEIQPSVIFNKSYTCKNCGKSDRKKITEEESCIGLRIGKLKIVKEAEKSKNGAGRLWVAECDCGNETIISTSEYNSSAKKSCGCLRKTNLVGDKYHKLTVIEQGYEIDDRKSKTLLCKVECECTRKKIVSACRLKRGDIQSCGICIRGVKKRKQKGEASKNAVYNKYIKSAKQRKILFLLKYDECIEFFENKCWYCGKEPSNCYQEKNCYGEYRYNGIDRLNPNVGYTKENCVSCCWECNKRKGNSTYEDFTKWIERIYNYHVKTKEK